MKFGTKMWDILLVELKNIVSLTLFKKKIREKVPKNSLCRFCKTYVPNIVFLLSTRMSLFYNMRHVVHIEESAQAVIDSKPKTP